MKLILLLNHIILIYGSTVALKTEKSPNSITGIKTIRMLSVAGFIFIIYSIFEKGVL